MRVETLTGISFGIALFVSSLLLVVPSYTTQMTIISEYPSRHRVEQEGHATILEVDGPYALIPLAVPVLIAATPVVFPKRPMLMITWSSDIPRRSAVARMIRRLA